VKSLGVKSIANIKTVEKCLELNLPVPEISFEDSLVFKFGGREIECRYFGAGHTVDNITVWLKDSHILFGGCLIKDLYSTSLGNLSDAVVPQWQATVESVITEYPHAQIVIPGHGKVGGVDILHKTIDLVKKETSKLN
jgi:metallo-beta-lactamase class B